MNSDDKDNKNIGHTQEIFEKKYGNVENFSRQKVGSLFDPEPEPEPIVPTYKRSGKKAEDEYEAYLSSASEENRRLAQKNQVAQEEAKRHIDSQLEDFPKSGRRMPVERDNSTYEQERVEVSRISRTTTGEKKSMPPLNMRNIMALALFVVLLVFAVMVWQMASLNSRLNAAISDLDELQEAYDLRYGMYNDAQAYIYGIAQGTTPNVATETTAPQDDDYEYPDATSPAEGVAETTTLPPQAALRTHTVAPGETLSSITRHFFGGLARMQEIIELNSIPDPDNLPVGTVLTIPSN
ncbi:MAG: LysM peptidoglycan-binding domain-containing protein [Defluviitaleaceae bacterium]|nr:LysM peptidoglycan-binding domain-containing protein [Defluviitaleaceae bacterium]